MGEGKVLEVIADIAIAGDLKGSLVASLHGRLAGADIGLVLRDRVEVGVKAGHAKLRDRVVLNRSGAVRGAIDRENKIITDLLSLVKMDRRSSDVNIQETNINQLIELILKRLRPIAAKRSIELVLESFKPVIAEVDETKLTLALSNLVETGIKYNKDEGWVHVSLNVDSKYFYVKVEDSGIGIPEESQEHIFERFYRVDKSHSREIGGTGLGLAITRSAVLMHHGAIKVYSREGEGTTFTVRIPLKYTA